MAAAKATMHHFSVARYAGHQHTCERSFATSDSLARHLELASVSASRAVSRRTRAWSRTLRTAATDAALSPFVAWTMASRDELVMPMCFQDSQDAICNVLGV